MDALKSYSDEESASEEEEQPTVDSPHGEDEPAEHSSPAASPPEAVVEEPEVKERTKSPPTRAREKGRVSRREEEHRKQRSRSRSSGHSRSPERESPSNWRRSRDHNRRQPYKGRDHGRRRSHSRSKSPVSRRRGSYHRRRSRSRSRSPTYRRRRSRSPDYHRKRRTSSGERRGRRRRSKSPSERLRRTEKKVAGSMEGSSGERGKSGNKTERSLPDSQEPKSTGFSAPPTATPPPQQQLQVKNGTLAATPPAVGGAKAPVMATGGQAPPTSQQPAVSVPQSVAGTPGLLPHPDNVSLTPEQRLEMALAASRAKGPQLPGFMNPTAMNPVKFQQIKEKRKLLWSGKKAQKQSRNQWESVSFGTDNKETAKFRRLMGINPSTTSSSSSANKDVQEEHSKRLSVLEHQYESSRFQTHIARGVGLGYGSAALTTELPSQKDSGDKLDEKL